MRVAVYDPYFDTLGGGERYSAAFTRVFIQHGDKVDIWWPENMAAQVKQRFGIDISAANFVNRRPSADYDILFWVSDGSLPTSWAKKTIIHFQFPFTAVGGKSWSNRIKSHFYTFIANSQFTKQFVDSEFGINSQVIYPPVGVDEIKPGKKENIILYVGRFSNLTQAKGHQVLIDVFKGISKQIPHWRMILVGGSGVGTDEVGMRQLISSIGHYPIDIVTNPTWAQLKKLYAKSKVYFSASGYGVNSSAEPLRVEHFGITVVEAMAAGCVPVVVDAGGHREIVTARFGYLWQRLDQARQLLVEICKDDANWQLFSARARKLSQKFSYNVFKEAMLQICEK